MMTASFDSPGSSAVTLTIFRSPIGVVARNSSVVTCKPYDFNCSIMYPRVFSSSADPAGRGPNSTCLRTCSKARSPSKADFAGAEEADGGAGPSAGLLVLLGHPISINGPIRISARAKTRISKGSFGAGVWSVVMSDESGSDWLFLFRRSALVGLHWIVRPDVIEDLLTQRSGSFRDLVKGLRSRDGFQLHERRNFTFKRQFAEFLAQVARLFFRSAGRFGFCVHG